MDNLRLRLLRFIWGCWTMSIGGQFSPQRQPVSNWGQRVDVPQQPETARVEKYDACSTWRCLHTTKSNTACILPTQLLCMHKQHISAVRIVTSMKCGSGQLLRRKAKMRHVSCLRLQNCSKMSKTSRRGLTSSSPPPSSRVPDAIIKSRRGNFATATSSPMQGRLRWLEKIKWKTKKSTRRRICKAGEIQTLLSFPLHLVLFCICLQRDFNI